MFTTINLSEYGYYAEKSISGSYWILMKDGEVIIDDSAYEDFNEDKETAEAAFAAMLENELKTYEVAYENYNVQVIEDSEYYHIDFRTGMGEAHYPKADWTLEEALKDQAEM